MSWKDDENKLEAVGIDGHELLSRELPLACNGDGFSVPSGHSIFSYRDELFIHSALLKS